MIKKSSKPAMSKRSLRLSLSISFMTMSIIVLIVSAVGIYYGVLDIWQKRAEKSSLQLFEQLQVSIDNMRHNVNKVSTLLLVDPDIQAYLDSARDMNSAGDSINLTNKVIERFSIVLKNYDYLSSIYLFTHAGTVVGASNYVSIYTSDALDSHWFYRSGLYENTQQLYPRIVWRGAARSRDFHHDVFRDGDDMQQLLVAMRGVKSINGTAQAGTLVVNINQKVLTDMYHKLAGEPGSNMFIYDEDGTIISNSDETTLGQTVAPTLISRIINHFGSFTEGDQQVIHYKLGDTGWTVIKQVPIREFVKDIWQLRNIMIGIFSLSLIAAWLISFYWIRKITTPIWKLGRAMQEMERGNLRVKLEQADNFELDTLARGFNRMVESIAELIAHNKQTQEQKIKLEIQMLQTQIQPHFLYNSLNAIKWMAIVIKADNISHSLTTLAGLLKPIFNRSDLMWSLQEEKTYITHYVELMNIRYGQGIRVAWDLSDSLLDDQVLRFIMQPVVENAIVHGMAAHHYTGDILFTAIENEDSVTIRIADSGSGIPPEKLLRLQQTFANGSDSGTDDTVSGGIGLVNVNKRLQLHFGKEYYLRISSEVANGTIVTMQFPKMKN